MTLPIESIEGIGEVYGEKLKGVGVKTTNDMIVYGPHQIFAKLQGSISETLLEKWHDMCLLMLIKGLGPQEAEALVDAGRHSWQTIDDTSPKRLHAIFKEAKAHRKIPKVPSEAKIARWQREAVRLQYTGFIAGKVLTKKGELVENTTITVGEESTVSDDAGSYVLAGIPLWEKSLTVEAEGYYRFETALELPGNQLKRLDLKLAKSPHGWGRPARISEWEGKMVTFQTGDRFKRLNVEVGDLPNGTPLAEYHKGRYRDGLIRLVPLFKIREGNQIIIYRIKVKPEQIHGGPPEGRVVLKKESGLVVMDQTVSDFQDEWIRQHSWINPNALLEVPSISGDDLK